ncbi:hypothetical protein ACH3XW_22470 [Acanthocheilonema viteae]
MEHLACSNVSSSTVINISKIIAGRKQFLRFSFYEISHQNCCLPILVVENLSRIIFGKFKLEALHQCCRDSQSSSTSLGYFEVINAWG